MTVHKFGNYLYIKTKQHRLAEPPIVKTTKEASFTSICIFTMKGSYSDGSTYYMLEGVSPKGLIGNTINNGDVIKLIRVLHHHQKKYLSNSFFLCLLIQDE